MDGCEGEWLYDVAVVEWLYDASLRGVRMPDVIHKILIVVVDHYILIAQTISVSKS